MFSFGMLVWLVTMTNVSTLRAIPDNTECGYFVYGATPIPLNLCQQKHNESVMYGCREDMISYNVWRNVNCSGPIHSANYLSSSDVSSVHNCNASASAQPASSCNLAVIDIWSNPYCLSSPYFKLLYVVDVCVALDATSSVFWRCDDRGIMEQDVFAETADCSGHPMPQSNGTLAVGGNGTESACF